MPTSTRDLSTHANLRAAFNLWPPGTPLPTVVDDVARAALALTLTDLLRGRGANVQIVRFADDEVSVWLLDALDGVTLQDLVRAVAGAFEPAAFAIGAVQPMRADGDPTVRGVHCRAMLGDAIIELTGKVTGLAGPPEQRDVPEWTPRRGHAHADEARWLGVPPTVGISLPMLGAAQA